MHVSIAEVVIALFLLVWVLMIEMGLFPHWSPPSPACESYFPGQYSQPLGSNTARDLFKAEGAGPQCIGSH